MPSLRSLQVPPSAPPKHTQKERTNISESVCFSLFLGFLAYFFSLLPYRLFYQRQLLFTPKLGSHCTKKIFFALPLSEKDFFALRLNKKDFTFNYNYYNILIYYNYSAKNLYRLVTTPLEYNTQTYISVHSCPKNRSSKYFFTNSLIKLLS